MWEVLDSGTITRDRREGLRLTRSRNTESPLRHYVHTDLGSLRLQEKKWDYTSYFNLSRDTRDYLGVRLDNSKTYSLSTRKRRYGGFITKDSFKETVRLFFIS